jgi:hypothetical protein
MSDDSRGREEADLDAANGRAEPADESAGVFGARPEPTEDPEGQGRNPIERGVAAQAATIAQGGTAVMPDLVPETPDDEHPTPV